MMIEMIINSKVIIIDKVPMTLTQHTQEKCICGHEKIFHFYCRFDGITSYCRLSTCNCVRYKTKRGD